VAVTTIGSTLTASATADFDDAVPGASTLPVSGATMAGVCAKSANGVTPNEARQAVASVRLDGNLIIMVPKDC